MSSSSVDFFLPLSFPQLLQSNVEYLSQRVGELSVQELVALKVCSVFPAGESDREPTGCHIIVLFF